jgi:hypothetical protein
MMTGEDRRLSEIVISVKACERPLRDALQHYEALRSVIQQRAVVLEALAAARVLYKKRAMPFG